MSEKDPRISIPVLHEPVIRVSMASFARIVSDNQYLLLLNFASLRSTGHTVLTPVGGGVRVLEEGLEELGRDVGLRREDLSGRRRINLVFQTTGMNAEALRLWFQRKQGREVHPRRELIEELSEMNKLVLAQDLEDAPITFAGYYSEVTQPKDGSLVPTLRIAEICDVHLPSRVIERLHFHAAKPIEEGWVRFVTSNEISLLQTSSGLEIGSISRALIHASQELPSYI